MRKCECGHPSSFHHSKAQKKSGGLAAVADSLASFGGSTSSAPRSDCNAKGCPCLRYTEVDDA